MFVPAVICVVEILDKIKDTAQSIARIQNEIWMGRGRKAFTRTARDDQKNRPCELGGKGFRIPGFDKADMPGGKTGTVLK